jgi:hypothetical protein
MKKILLFLAIVTMASLAGKAATSESTSKSVHEKLAGLTKIDIEKVDSIVPFGWLCFTHEIGSVIRTDMEGNKHVIVLYQINCYYYEVPSMITF